MVQVKENVLSLSRSLLFRLFLYFIFAFKMYVNKQKEMETSNVLKFNYLQIEELFDQIFLFCTKLKLLFPQSNLACNSSILFIQKESEIKIWREKVSKNNLLCWIFHYFKQCAYVFNVYTPIFIALAKPLQCIVLSTNFIFVTLSHLELVFLFVKRFFFFSFLFLSAHKQKLLLGRKFIKF